MRLALGRILILTLALMGAACERHAPGGAEKAGFADMASPAPAAPEAAEARARQAPGGADTPASAAQRDARTRYLAYEHTLNVQAPEARIAALHQQARDACQAEAAEQCVVLGATLSTSSETHATLRLRAGRAAIGRLTALLGSGGDVVGRSTRADDLSRSIEDTDTRLAMLADYRTRLQGLRERASSNIEALIKVNQELAQVQSQIEAASGQRAGLMQRVDTEILAVTITSSERSPAWRQLREAFRNFGANFTSGTAGVVNAVAYLAPGVVVLLLFLWGLRKLWIRVRRPRTQG